MEGARILEDGDRAAAAGRPLGAISTLVSLFLLLLVFFIVLFSVSQVHRQRLGEVVNSIDVAFGGLPSRLGLVPKSTPGDSDTATPEGFIRAISTLVTGFSPLVASGRIEDGPEILRIDLEPERLFQPNAAGLTAEAVSMIRPLAVLLQRRPNAKQHFRMIVRMPAPAAPDSPEGQREVARSASFAAALFGAGCPADTLAVGLEPALGPIVRLDFELVGPAPDPD